MSSQDSKEELKTEVMFSSFHYMIAVIFFLVVLMNTLYLTQATVRMNVDSSDTNAVKAKNLMIGACAVSYFGDLLILCLLIGSYWYNSYRPDEADKYSKQIMSTTGGKDIYTAIRILIFSTLMIVSLIVGGLCLDAANYINKSDDPSQYNTEYNLCKDIGQMFMLHFIVFTLLQGVVSVGKLFYDSGNIHKLPESIEKEN